MKKAIITGITGQDGAYLSKFLLEQGYQVFGAYRRVSSINFWRLDELDVINNLNFTLIEFDLTDLSSIIRVLDRIQPDEFYNLAAQSFVGVSFEQPITTTEITGVGPLNILEGIRIVNNEIKFYQASSSEMFGHVQSVPQNESTSFYPRSPYGIAKLFAHWTTINYRESYNIFGASGILFNHESPLRGKEFVTRKITYSVAKIKLGKMDYFELGNIDAKRDWGYAQDYVIGMWKMLQVNRADSYVLSTSTTKTVREFVIKSFACVDIDVVFKGVGLDEVGYNKKTNKILFKINPKFYRPSEVDLLIGDSSKAARELNWKAETSLDELCALMIEADLNKVQINFAF